MSTDDCPFCNLNEPVVAETATGFVVVPSSEKTEGEPRSYLIIPKRHVETMAELPASWWSTLVWLVAEVTSKHGWTDYNLSLNVGRKAGQRVSHLHFWLIRRDADEAAPSHGLGLNAMIKKLDGTD